MRSSYCAGLNGRSTWLASRKQPEKNAAPNLAAEWLSFLINMREVLIVVVVVVIILIIIIISSATVL
jgi:hypothetical protein